MKRFFRCLTIGWGALAAGSGRADGPRYTGRQVPRANTERFREYELSPNGEKVFYLTVQFESYRTAYLEALTFDPKLPAADLIYATEIAVDSYGSAPDFAAEHKLFVSQDFRRAYVWWLRGYGNGQMPRYSLLEMNPSDRFADTYELGTDNVAEGPAGVFGSAERGRFWLPQNAPFTDLMPASSCYSPYNTVGVATDGWMDAAGAAPTFTPMAWTRAEECSTDESAAHSGIYQSGATRALVSSDLDFSVSVGAFAQAYTCTNCDPRSAELRARYAHGIVLASTADRSFRKILQVDGQVFSAGYPRLSPQKDAVYYIEGNRLKGEYFRAGHTEATSEATAVLSFELVGDGRLYALVQDPVVNGADADCLYTRSLWTAQAAQLAATFKKVLSLAGCARYPATDDFRHLWPSPDGKSVAWLDAEKDGQFYLYYYRDGLRSPAKLGRFVSYPFGGEPSLEDTLRFDNAGRYLAWVEPRGTAPYTLSVRVYDTVRASTTTIFAVDGNADSWPAAVTELRWSTDASTVGVRWGDELYLVQRSHGIERVPEDAAKEAARETKEMETP